MADDNDEGAEKAAGLTLNLDVEKDTLTAQNETVGLAQSYVARTLVAAADDIADIVIRATNSQEIELLVVAGGGFRSDADRAVAVRLQIDALLSRLDSVVPPARGYSTHNLVGFSALTLGTLASSILGALPSAASSLTKVLAGQYTTAGSVLDVVKGAVDLRVAGAIRSKLREGTRLSVRIERLWTPDKSPLADDVATLLDRCGHLLGALEEAVERKQTAKATLDAALATKTSAETQLVELCKELTTDKTLTDGSPWSIAWEYAKGNAEKDLSGPARAYEKAVSEAAELESVKTSVESFLVGLLAVDANGALPLASAMRGEWLRDPDAGRRIVLYVNALHGGVDQVLETKLGPDKRVVLAGSSVEFALADIDGTVAGSGVRDNLWGGMMQLDHIDRFEGQLVDSVFERTAERVEPAAASGTSLKGASASAAENGPKQGR